MKRESPRGITIGLNIRALRVYPVEETKKDIDELKSIGLRLSKEQAIHLARVLLAVTQEWNEIEITAYRFDRRQTDGTYHITVASRHVE